MTPFIPVLSELLFALSLARVYVLLNPLFFCALILHVHVRPWVYQLSPDAVDALAGPLEAGQVVGCPCGLAVGSGGFMLDCDRCHRWFHAPCVGIDEHNPPDQW
jgi:hypothetical protein